ncbi:helix-turn-helix transcriptional regulator [Actinoplanes sp. RD1]|uniref:helix-turn-helix transcriptional regulator n=1 Tax=Actinoplanes sp. RD1 TaxID=3064538 RepID=UPI002741D375|nr:WYL domain-containing protein [Actinoplanes sp. RD1]
MTRPTARVLTVLEVLQSGGTRTAADLAARVGVDERTLRRYIEHLIDLEVPVESVRGRYGGYRLAPGFRMPPLMLTDEEALAVLLGLTTGPSGPSGLPAGPSGPAAESAAAKVRRVLPRPLATRLEGLLATLEFTSPPSSSPPPPPSPSLASSSSSSPLPPPSSPSSSPEAGLLLRLASAARDRRPVALDYTGREGRRSTRTLHPYGIVAHAGRWYVTGADSASGEVRTFRLDRIAGAGVLAGTFEVPAGFSPAGQVTGGVAYRHEVSVVVDGPAELVRRRLRVSGATVDDLGGERARVRLSAERLDWVPGVLAGLGLPFVVEHPDELRDHVRDLARRLDAAVVPRAE